MKDSINKNINILIVDDHPVFRKGLIHLINDEDAKYICSEAEDVFTAIQMFRNKRPDMVIVDLSLKDSSGFELIKYISDHEKSFPILVVSMHDEILYAERSFKAGARGYIMKQEMPDNIGSAIRKVITGNIYLSEKMNNKLVADMFNKTNEKQTEEPSVEDEEFDPTRYLTDRELEIFSLLGKGFKRKQISEKLNLNVNTVGTYRERIKEKLNLETSSEMTALAILWVKGLKKNSISGDMEIKLKTNSLQ